MDLETLASLTVQAGMIASTVYIVTNAAVAELNKVAIDAFYFGQLTPEAQSEIGKPSRRELYSQAIKSFPKMLYNDWKISEESFALPISEKYQSNFHDATSKGQTKLQQELRNI